MIQGAIACDQSTCFDSSSCSRKLPGGVEELLGDDRRPEPRLGERDALAGLVGAAPLEVPAHRRDVEDGDLLAFEHADPTVSFAERHKLHAVILPSGTWL